MPKVIDNMPKSQSRSVVHQAKAGFEPHRVVALIYDQLCTFEYGIVAEIFGLERPEISGSWYEFKSVALEEGPLQAAGGLEISGGGTRDDLANADTIIIPGWRGKDADVPSSICSVLQRASKNNVRIVSICSGIYVLAQAGLLEGRSVTTHWRYADDFARKYPTILLEADRLYVDDGDILTSAGSSAGIDLCLHIVRKDFGTRTANSVARRLVIHAHRQGGQAQYIEQPVLIEQEAHRLSGIIEHIRANINQPLSVPELAQRAGMSVRTFQRKFSAVVGLPIGRWINQERLNCACNLLETTQAPIDDIANAVGVANVEALRYHFRNGIGVSPGEYRKRFNTNV